MRLKRGRGGVSDGGRVAPALCLPCLSPPLSLLLSHLCSTGTVKHSPLVAYASCMEAHWALEERQRGGRRWPSLAGAVALRVAPRIPASDRHRPAWGEQMQDHKSLAARMPAPARRAAARAAPCAAAPPALLPSHPRKRQQPPHERHRLVHGRAGAAQHRLKEEARREQRRGAGRQRDEEGRGVHSVEGGDPLLHGARAIAGPACDSARRRDRRSRSLFFSFHPPKPTPPPQLGSDSFSLLRHARA